MVGNVEEEEVSSLLVRWRSSEGEVEASRGEMLRNVIMKKENRRDDARINDLRWRKVGAVFRGGAGRTGPCTDPYDELYDAFFIP